MTIMCVGCGALFANAGAYANHIRYHACSTEDERFWAKVDKNGPGGCWLWKGVTNERGYGMTYHKGNRNYRAHRYTWEQVHGSTPSDRFCLHKCDVRNCVNPDHLYLGSYKENARDAISRDRHVRGERNSHALLTPEQVLEIRRDYRCWIDHGRFRSNVAELMERYPAAAQNTIVAAARGRTWKHLPQPQSPISGG